MEKTIETQLMMIVDNIISEGRSEKAIFMAKKIILEKHNEIVNSYIKERVEMEKSIMNFAIKTIKETQ